MTRETRVVNEFGGHPLAWLMRRNQRMAEQLEDFPFSGQVLAKVMRGFDHFCSRYGLDRRSQRQQVDADVFYDSAADRIVITFKRPGVL